MKPASILLLALGARAATYSSHSLEKLSSASDKPAPAPAPAPAPGPASPAAATLAALQVSFEIKNYNYYDLTKETCPRTVKDEGNSKVKTQKAKGKKADSGHPGLGGIIEEIAHHADELAAGLGPDSQKPPPPPWMKKNAAVETAPPPSVPEPSAPEEEEDTPSISDIGVKRDKPEPLPWMKDKEEESGSSSSLLSTGTGLDRICVMTHSSLAAIHAQSDQCKTVMDVFRSAITEVVRDVIKCLAAMPAAGAPAAAPPGSPAAAALPPAVLVPAPKAFLQSAPAPAPSPGGPPEPAIHVTFSPGKEVGSGRSVMVEITFTDTPSNGLDDVALTKGIIELALKSGLLKRELKAALAIVAGIWPKVGKVSVKTAEVEGWDVKKCEGHVRNIVQQFSHHYTREQVPMAMFNECTNFMTRISFSNDHVLDPVDTLACRKTTASFAKHWNFGEKAKPEDFVLMCVRSCEAKFGKKAPQCHVEAGDELAGKPLL